MPNIHSHVPMPGDLKGSANIKTEETPHQPVPAQDQALPAAEAPPAVQAEPLSLLGRAKQMLNFFTSDHDLKIPDRVVELKQLQSGALKVLPGETFAVRVRENASTGYRWQVSSENLTPLGDLAQSPKGRRDGSSADRFFVFQAPQEGQAKLSLSHGRPAEPETQKVYPATIQLAR